MLSIAIEASVYEVSVAFSAAKPDNALVEASIHTTRTEEIIFLVILIKIFLLIFAEVIFASVLSLFVIAFVQLNNVHV